MTKRETGNNIGKDLIDISGDNKGSKKFKKINKGIFTAIIGLIMTLTVLAYIYLFIQIRQGYTPSIFGYRFYYILTDSMTPELEVNDVILSKVLNTPGDKVNNIKKGDVVTFIAEYGAQKGLTITHKVIEPAHYDEEISRIVITTQGVKPGAMPDPPVPIENVTAVMVKEVKILGALYRFFITPSGLILLFILPITVAVGIMVARLIATIKGKTITPSKAPRTREEIARQAVLDYIRKKELEEKIAKKAVEDYIRRHQNKDGGGKPD